MAAIGLWLLGVPYFFVLGIWMAVTAILPYIGAFLGGIPAVIIALTISWQLAVVTIVLYVVINQVEGNLITPRIQGNAVQGPSGHDLHRGAAGQRAGRHPRRDHRRADAGDRTRAGRILLGAAAGPGTHDTLLAAIGGDSPVGFHRSCPEQRRHLRNRGIPAPRREAPPAATPPAGDPTRHPGPPTSPPTGCPACARCSPAATLAAA